MVYEPKMNENVIPVEVHDVEDFTNSQYGKSFEQWRGDRKDLTMDDLIVSNDQAEVNRLQGALREIKTMLKFPYLLIEELETMAQDEAREKQEEKDKEK